MDSKHLPYVHVFLFRCKHCNEPIALSVKSIQANLEKTSSGTFDVECKCGWSQTLFGVQAVTHWVATWGISQEDGQPRPRQGESDISQQA